MCVRGVFLYLLWVLYARVSSYCFTWSSHTTSPGERLFPFRCSANRLFLSSFTVFHLAKWLFSGIVFLFVLKCSCNEDFAIRLILILHVLVKYLTYMGLLLHACVCNMCVLSTQRPEMDAGSSENRNYRYLLAAIWVLEIKLHYSQPLSHHLSSSL